MSIIANNLLQGDDGYNISRSLRFRSSANAYLSRTQGTPTNQLKYTISLWVKRPRSGVVEQVITAGPYPSATSVSVGFGWGGGNNDLFNFRGMNTGSPQVAANGVIRDPSSWYNFIVAVDTTQATAANRVRLYKNGAEVTYQSIDYPAQNSALDFNTSGKTISIGVDTGASSYFDGYLTEINFIDGQQLTPSSFGETDLVTGVWKPKKYAGTYGTNGFYLPFSDNTSTTTLGYDKSGNSNNWTTNNISLTAGSTYDSMVDVPTMSALGSNYCVLNPLNAIGTTATFSNANLSLVLPDGSVARTAFATMGVSSGKWYWEMTVGTTAATYYPGIGVNTNTSALPTNQSGADATGYMYMVNGQKFNNGSLTSYGATYATNDVIGVALDMDAGTITFYKNNTSQGQAFSGLSGTAVPCFIGQVNASCSVNFGQRPWAYTPPTGFVALNVFNLPEPSIKQGNKHFDIVNYTGTGSARSVTGIGFQPDWLWIKKRSAIENHAIYDAIRGAGKRIESSTTSAEDSESGGISAFISDGFSISGANDRVNTNSATYVAWQWKANGTGSSNTAGSITSTVSANPTAGFSVVTWTNNGSANQSIGHGLGVTPSMIITKDRDNGTFNWATWFTGFTKDEYLLLNTTGAKASFNTLWYLTPDSSKFYIGSTGTGVNNGTDRMVAYCFAPVTGYSAFGSYTGNGSADGTFVHCGFRPKFVIVKSSSVAGTGWYTFDTSRTPSNVMGQYLESQSSGAEGTFNCIDFLSNGFKFREGANAGFNQSGQSYIYMAFAENPTKYALGR